MTDRGPNQRGPDATLTSSPFTSGTITVGYPFDENERQQRDELERLADGAAHDDDGGEAER